MSTLSDLADQAAAKYNVPASLYESLINVESNWNSNAISSKGATGLAQIMPGNWSSLGITNPFDPGQSLDAGANLLSQYYNQMGSWFDALRAYNAGTALAKSNPLQSADYATKILTNAGMNNQIGQTNMTTSNDAPSFWSDPLSYLSSKFGAFWGAFWTGTITPKLWTIGAIALVIVLAWFGVQQLIKE